MPHPKTQTSMQKFKSQMRYIDELLNPHYVHVDEVTGIPLEMELPENQEQVKANINTQLFLLQTLLTEVLIERVL